jgi:hypothetical protein
MSYVSFFLNGEAVWHPFSPRCHKVKKEFATEDTEITVLKLSAFREFRGKFGCNLG